MMSFFKKSGFLAVVAFVLFAVSSCDVIKDPVKNPSGGNTIEPGEVVQRILLEEYTGHQCQNCPEAIETANQMKDLFGKDRVIVVAIHAGNFANTNANFPREFRHPEGTQHYNFYNIIRGVPSGMVNRVDYSPTSPAHIKTHGNWPTIANEQLAKEPLMEISIKPSYNAATRNYSTEIDVDIISNINGEFNLGLYVTESGVISPQISGSQTIPEFIHNHIFRGSVNGIFGQSLMSGNIPAGSKYSEILTGNLGTDVVEGNVDLVVFVKNAQTHEIVQVNKVKLIN